MTEADIERYREQLWVLHHRLNGDMHQLSNEALRQTGGDAGGNLSNTPLHMADLGSDQFEQEHSLGLLENEEKMLEEVTGALNRIHRGTFGKCEECGIDIAAERLQAIPYTRHCIECARKVQEGGGA